MIQTIRGLYGEGRFEAAYAMLDQVVEKYPNEFTVQFRRFIQAVNYEVRQQIAARRRRELPDFAHRRLATAASNRWYPLNT